MPKNVFVGWEFLVWNFENYFWNDVDAILFYVGFMGVTYALDKNVGEVILDFLKDLFFSLLFVLQCLLGGLSDCLF